jgi:hypothetical protein
MLAIRKAFDEPVFGQEEKIEQPAVEERDTGLELGLVQTQYVDVSELDHGFTGRSLVLEPLLESWILYSATVARRNIPYSCQEMPDA